MTKLFIENDMKDNSFARKTIDLGVRGKVDLNVAMPLIQPDASFLQPFIKFCELKD